MQWLWYQEIMQVPKTLKWLYMFAEFLLILRSFHGPMVKLIQIAIPQQIAIYQASSN